MRIFGHSPADPTYLGHARLLHALTVHSPPAHASSSLRSLAPPPPIPGWPRRVVLALDGADGDTAAAVTAWASRSIFRSGCVAQSVLNFFFITICFTILLAFRRSSVDEAVVLTISSLPGRDDLVENAAAARCAMAAAALGPPLTASSRVATFPYKSGLGGASLAAQLVSALEEEGPFHFAVVGSRGLGLGQRIGQAVKGKASVSGARRSKPRVIFFL